MYENIIEVIEVASYASTVINEYLDKGWIILNTFQYENKEEGQSHGTVLLGWKATN